MSNSRKPSFQTNSTKSFQERSPKRTFNDKERRFDDRRNNEKREGNRPHFDKKRDDRKTFSRLPTARSERTENC